MKGARGLLISITGGRDLTLYEVDEAATRIREEVDQEANIIVGATFDESLDGIIRVSVVATGIDQQSAVGAAPQNPIDARLAELTQKLRAPPLNEGVDRFEHGRRAGDDAEYDHRLADEAGAHLPPTTIEDVVLRPIPPKPSLFLEPLEEPAAVEPPNRAFIPPQPERPLGRGPRMPRIEELPLPAQNAIWASRGELADSANPERR